MYGVLSVARIPHTINIAETMLSWLPGRIVATGHFNEHNHGKCFFCGKIHFEILDCMTSTIEVDFPGKREINTGMYTD
ncbi:hypothetical protein UPYG_G00094570 [Umbra pygmaea]|uniref:Uncharacterized protein n=1 Tax=Umbra pygmaea TaxID=75934 RepID=A0ABD0XPE2_UMBPY